MREKSNGKNKKGKSMKIAIKIRNLNKIYDTSPPLKALDNFNLDIYENEFVCVIGPSGCGKSTLLKIIAGFEPYDNGEVLVENKPVRCPGPDRFVVHQEFDQLLPWKTVYQNIDFGLFLKGISEEKSEKSVKEIIDLVGLKKFENRYPHELSGGMQQRVAMARALVMDPSVLLMDEPFGSLDAQMRKSLGYELVRIWQEIPKTIFFVTHNIHESVRLADRVVVMTSQPGKVKKIINVDLPRPRKPGSKEFAEIWDKIVNIFPSSSRSDNKVRGKKK